nr:class I tRNA ligase family protein [Pseudomonadota bacterium]
AMLHGSGFRMPTCVYAHGFLTVNNAKMSKSRGTFINAREYLDNLDPEYLRYYFAAKLGDGVDDIDFNFDDFLQRVNSDLVGKVINIASRCAGFITKKFDGKLARSIGDDSLFLDAVQCGERIAALFEARCYSHAVREIMAIADQVNQYIAEQAPWTLAKQDENRERVQLICSIGLNCFKVIMTYLQPITPVLAEKTQVFLNCEPLSWQNLTTPLLDHQINEFVPMLTRIEQTAVDKLMGETA